jgi:hypothetical protein
MDDDFYVFVPREPCSSAAMAEDDQQRMRWMEIGCLEDEVEVFYFVSVVAQIYVRVPMQDIAELRQRTALDEVLSLSL